MEQGRLFLAIVLSIAVFFVWELVFVEKQKVQQSKAPEKKSEQTVQGPATTKPARPTAEAKQPVEPGEPGGFVKTPGNRFKTLMVQSRLYSVRISEKGAALVSFVLKDYRESIDKGSKNKELISPDNPVGTVLVGFAGNGLSEMPHAAYTTDFSGNTLRVADSPQTLSFFLQSASGIFVEKRYTFYADSYQTKLDIIVKNLSNQIVKDDLIVSLTNPPPDEKRRFAFEGPFAYANDKLEQFTVKKLDKKNSLTGDIAWIGIEDQYFMTALIPEDSPDADMRIIYAKADNLLKVRYVKKSQTLAPGAEKHYGFSVFIGPKRMSVLKACDANLDKAINFGFFDFLAKPCLWLMNLIHDRFIPNYGIAIILLTILFKVIFWPLGTKSYKSMAEMKKLQPLMAEIRQKYKDDKKKMNEEIMGLYRTYKVNPMSGCLPMIVQIPVFFAFYRMLYGAIELRHAPFMLWINDLSAPDRLLRFHFAVPMMTPPYGIPVLTVIMGVTMFVQQKLSPPPGDPSQAKFMMMMPLIFTVIFINFPSGLVLYWLVNNILSIAQQYYITRRTL